MASGKDKPGRWHRPSMVVWVGLILAGVVPPIRRLSSGGGGWPDWMLIAAVILGIAYTVIDGYRWRRRVHQLIETEWRRCPRCFFDLRGLPENGKCPECGESYVIRKVREWWKDVIAGEMPGARSDEP